MSDTAELLVTVEAGISAADQRGATLAVYQSSIFSANCYIEPALLSIARSLKSANLSASCQVRNAFDLQPISYQMQVDVSWAGTGKKDRNKVNGGVGREATAAITVTVTGPSGSVVIASTTVAGGYLAALPTQ